MMPFPSHSGDPTAKMHAFQQHAYTVIANLAYFGPITVALPLET